MHTYRRVPRGVSRFAVLGGPTRYFGQRPIMVVNTFDVQAV